MSNTGDETLAINITAGDMSAGPAVSDMEARLAALETQATKSTTATTGFSAGLNDLANHSLLAARGFEALGLDADAAASKIDGLAKVLEQVSAAAPGLLAIGAALAVVSSSISFFKEGVQLAGEFEAQMVSLGTAVRLQGGNWAEASEGVKKYLEIQEQATGYDQNEVLTALNALVVRGASLSDAYYEVAVSEDVAAATHKDLLEVVNLLTSAEGQRAAGLERLDPRLKTMIQDHADLFTIVHQLEEDFEGQASAALGTYEGHVRSMNAAWDEFKRDTGAWLLPFLEKIDDLSASIARSLDMMVKAAHSASFGGGLLMPPMYAGGLSEPSAPEAQKQRQAAINAQHGLDFDPHVGTSTAGAGYDPSFVHLTRDSTNYADPTKDNDRATEMMRAFASVEGDLEAKVKGATSTVDEQAAKITLLAQKAADAQAELNALTVIVGEDRTAFANQSEAVKAAHAALNAAQSAENAYEQSLKGTQHETDAQKDKQHELAAAVQAANDKYEAARQVLEKLSTTLKSHDDLLQKAKTDVVSFGADYQQALDAAEKADNDFLLKQTDQQTEFVATFNKTNAQKVHIYDELIAQLSSDDVDYYQRWEALSEKRQQAWEAAQDDIAKAYKQWIDDATKETETFVDDVVLKHQSMAQELKNIFQEIEKNWVDTFAKMAIGQNGGGPLSFLFGSPTMPVGSNTITQLGVGGSANQPTFTQGALNVHVQSAGSDYLTSTTGNTTGVATTSITQQMNTLSPGETATKQTMTDVGSGIGAIIGGTGIGAGLGSLLSGGTTNGADANLGGLIGGAGAAIGLAMTGGLIAASGGALAPLAPLILAGSSAVGSLLGGLFGPHETAADQPDLTNPTYGQDLANWQGGGVTAGNQFYTPGQQYWTANGGVSQSAQIANLIDTTNLQSLTTAQQQVVQQLIQLNGGTSGNNLGITAENQGILSFGSGQTMSVTQWQSLLAQYTGAFGNGATAGSPIYSIARSYPDFNLGSLTNTGTSTPATNAGTQVGNVTVIVNNPMLVGPGGLNQVAVQIGQAIYQAQQGNVPGSPATYRGIGPSIGASATSVV